MHLGTAESRRLTRLGSPPRTRRLRSPSFLSPRSRRARRPFLCAAPPGRNRRRAHVLGAGRPRLKRRTAADAALFSVLASGDGKALADLFLLEAGPAGLSAAHLGARLGVVSAAAANLLETLAGAGRALKIAPALFAHSSVASGLAARAAALFAERRKAGSAAVALGKGEFLARLARGISPAAGDGWLATLAAGRTIALEGDRVVPPGAKAADLSGEAASFAAKLEDLYRKAGFEPPKGFDAAKALGTKPQVVDGLVSHLVKSGLLVRLSPTSSCTRTSPPPPKEARDREGPDARGRGVPRPLGLTRKTLIPLEYLDSRKLTRRVGTSGKSVSAEVRGEGVARRFFFRLRSPFFLAESIV